MDRAVAAPAVVTAEAAPVSTRQAKATAALVTGTARAKAAHPRPGAVPVFPEADLALLAPAGHDPAWAPAPDSAPALLGAPAHGQVVLALDLEPPGLARYRAAVPTLLTGRLPTRRLTARVPAVPVAAQVVAVA